MSEEFHVSVIIPVYNAAEFVTQAVESALAQPETGEVILIEDNSPDNSLEVCQQLAAKYERVKLLRHPDGENHGAGASRNLGMRNTRFDYIAFLDADDYFLPNRFREAARIMQEDITCDGVYEAIGMHVEDQESWRRWQESGKPSDFLKTMKIAPPPESLAQVLLDGKHGHFSLDGFTIRKLVLDKSGFMDETLRIHQDTNFIIRVASVARLLPGNLVQPVSMWRVHQENRVSAPKTKEQRKAERMHFLVNTYSWFKEVHNRDFQKKISGMIFTEVIRIDENYSTANKLSRFLKRIDQYLSFLKKHPEMRLETQLWSSLSLFLVTFGRKS